VCDAYHDRSKILAAAQAHITAIDPHRIGQVTAYPTGQQFDVQFAPMEAAGGEFYVFSKITCKY